MFSLQPISRLFITVALLCAFPVVADAGERKIVIEFDKSSICCIMNLDLLGKKLEEVDGINTAHFNMGDRKIFLYYETEKITVPEIIKKVSRITKVEENNIALAEED
jgi:hypothetical protein